MDNIKARVLYQNYEIDGLKLVKSELGDSKYRYVMYKGWFYQMTIASDDMGTQLCHNGAFYGRSFRNVEEGVDFLRLNTEVCKRFFRKVWLHSLKYKFSGRNLQHQYWRVRHYFDPNFYLT